MMVPGPMIRYWPTEQGFAVVIVPDHGGNVPLATSSAHACLGCSESWAHFPYMFRVFHEPLKHLSQESISFSEE